LNAGRAASQIEVGELSLNSDRHRVMRKMKAKSLADLVG
jgi:FixJ family two-component response regulator